MPRSPLPSLLETAADARHISSVLEIPEVPRISLNEQKRNLPDAALALTSKRKNRKLSEGLSQGRLEQFTRYFTFVWQPFANGHLTDAHLAQLQSKVCAQFEIPAPASQRTSTRKRTKGAKSTGSFSVHLCSLFEFRYNAVNGNLPPWSDSQDRYKVPVAVLPLFRDRYVKWHRITGGVLQPLHIAVQNAQVHIPWRTCVGNFSRIFSRMHAHTSTLSQARAHTNASSTPKKPSARGKLSVSTGRECKCIGEFNIARIRQLEYLLV